MSRRKNPPPLKVKFAAQRASGVTAEEAAARLSPRYIAPGYAAQRAELLAGVELGEARAALRKTAAVKPQVTGFLSALGSTDTRKLQKLSDLGQWAGRTVYLHERKILTDPGERRRKYSIETGFDDRTGQEALIPRPLEPWTGPDGSMRLYAQIMAAADGATSIGDYSAADLDSIEYFRQEQLVSIGDDGRLHALSDMIREGGGRSYPGAPVPDSCHKVNGAHTCVSWADGRRCASFGLNLGTRAIGKVLAALFNISRGGTVHWSRKNEQKIISAAGGMRLTVPQICAEANQLMAGDEEFREYRFLSVATCRELVKALIELGWITEVIAAKAVRRLRSWFTLPRVIARLAGDMAEFLDDIIDEVRQWRRERREQRKR